MEEQINDINFVIIRYLDGSATLEEKLVLLKWLKQSNSNRADFTETRDLWLSCNALPDNELEVNIALDRFKARIMSEYKKKPESKILYLIRKYQAVAMIGLLIGIGCMMSVVYFSQPKAIIQKQLITAKGSKGQFTLPDGTIVWLNSESQLIYPEEFATDKRVVTLEGGAYFEVEKNKQKPFIVQTKHVDIEVLGTSFNVSSYDSHDFFNTALLEGSIRLSGQVLKKELTLQPGQLFEYNEKDKKMKVRNVNTQLYTDWIKEKLIFDNARLSDIITSLEGWYNIRIDCPSEFASRTRMSFTVRGEGLDEILQAMSFIAPVKYNTTNEIVNIRPNK